MAVKNDGIRVESSGFGRQDSGWSLDPNFEWKSLVDLQILGMRLKL